MLAFIDPVLYARVVYVGEGEVSAAELADFTRATDPARALGAWRSSLGAPRAALFREAYRYWLGLRLPFLYRHATLTLAREQAEFRRLAAGRDALREWRVPSTELDPLDIERAPHALSPRSLVDALVSLTSRRIEGRHHEDADPGTSAAAHVLQVATAIVGDAALALRGLAAMIVASLHTSDPVRAFTCCASGLRQAPAESSTVSPAAWWSLIRAWLGQLALMGDDGTMPRPLSMADALRSRKEHPLITASAREWESRAEDEASHVWFVLDPHRADHTVAESVWRDFQPAVNLYCFDRGAAPRQVVTVIDGDALSSSGASFTADAVQQLLTVHGIMRRAAGLAPLSPRLCTHTTCRHHADAHCSWYPFVPRQPARCSFPVRLARMRVDARGDPVALSTA